MSNRRFYCTANSPIGRFGDLIWAATRAAAEAEFHRIHGVYPTLVKLIRGAW
jgi:hypothetical protein